MAAMNFVSELKPFKNIALVNVGDLEIYQEEMVDGIPGGLNHRILFSLINIEFVQVKCVAYGSMALQLYHFWNSTVAIVVLCVLKFWRIEWRKRPLKHVSNYEMLSRMLFEPGFQMQDIEDIGEDQKNLMSESA
ncbi:hypothetical protein F2Q69_00005389 [Brassica cretica]|uniref:Uncharacterized protein n=1 Tax=Brassica cretica TaxID=69181 RepID=A0A8S9NYU2_BRACR|nr:hypothetical protein F2Q69_00005389 [Brassica cretica]